jgi:hypothetical protein
MQYIHAQPVAEVCQNMHIISLYMHATVTDCGRSAIV